MTSQASFDLVYDPLVKQHLQVIERKYHSLIRQTIEEQLQFEPEVETKNRKPLKRPIAIDADWEIRFGPDNRFRVFYQVDRENTAVYILAIGVKPKNQLFIGGEVIEL
jgi:mRNA-degrading endonuclease RelE of RelBE toxin-antitoxin system